VYTNDTAKEHLLQLSEHVVADVWSVNKDWVEVMVSPMQLHKFKHFTHSVQFEDVQALIDESERDNNAARSNSNVSAFPFTHFPLTSEVRTWLKSQQMANPTKATIEFLGNTYQGKAIEGLSLTLKANAPIIFLQCAIHAREWITVTTCAWIIDQLLNVDPDRDHLLTQFNWIIVPIFNVDGYDYSHTSDRLWRKNRQPNSGSTCIGTDLNRNFGYQWGGVGASTNPCSETYRGSAAWSGPASNAEKTFLTPHFNKIVGYVDIHSYGGYFLSAWGYTTTLPPNYSEMNKNMVPCVNAIRSVNGRTYAHGPSSTTLYATSGTTVDDLYGAGKVVNAYTIECYGTSFTPPTSWIEPIGKEVWAGIKQLAILLQ
jgi:murein tripeptide amidase MpaA